MLFSVIIVCLNPGLDLIASVQSVLTQSVDGFELIIKDGNSTDGSLTALPADPRLTLLISTDGGIFDAMNQALDHARGEYVHFLNAGDTFTDSHVLRDVAQVVRVNPGAEFFYGDVEKAFTRSGFEIYPERLSRRYLFANTVCHQGWFVRRSTYLRYGGFEVGSPSGADPRLLLRMIVGGDMQHAHVPRIVARYKGAGISARTDRVLADSTSLAAVKREVYSPFEYALFYILSAACGALKRIAYDRLGWRIWRRVRRFQFERRRSISKWQ